MEAPGKFGWRFLSGGRFGFLVRIGVLLVLGVVNRLLDGRCGPCTVWAVAPLVVFGCCFLFCGGPRQQLPGGFADDHVALFGNEAHNETDLFGRPAHLVPGEPDAVGVT